MHKLDTLKLVLRCVIRINSDLIEIDDKNEKNFWKGKGVSSGSKLQRKRNFKFLTRSLFIFDLRTLVFLKCEGQSRQRLFIVANSDKECLEKMYYIW